MPAQLFRAASAAITLSLLAMIQAQRDCTAPPPPASPKICCPWMDGGTTYNDTIYIDCWEQFAQFPMVPIPGGGVAGGPAGCVSECLFNYLDVFDHNSNDDGKLINFYALNDHVKEISEPDRYPLMYLAMRYCIGEANRRATVFREIQQRDPPVVPGLDNCNPISGFAMSCMHAYAIRFCPDWTPNEEEGCDELLDFYSQCPLNPY